MINKSKFLDNYFKFLVLFFWPMIWYKWVIISEFFIDIVLVAIFCILAIIYMALFIPFSLKNSDTENHVILYRVCMLLAFISTLFSFLLFPTSLFLLSLKIFFILIFFYYSYIKVFKYKDDEGLIGILSCILLIAITFLY